MKKDEKIKIKKVKIEKPMKDYDFFKEQHFDKIENPLKVVWLSQFPKQILIIAIIVILLIFALMNLGVIKGFFAKVINILQPILWGWVLTFIVSPLYNLIKNNMMKKREASEKVSNIMATIVCVIVVILAAVGLVVLFVPQLYISLTSFIEKSNGYANQVKGFFENFKSNFATEDTKPMIDNLISSINETISKFSDISKLDFGKIIGGIYNGFYFSLKFVINVFIALIAMIYTLNIKSDLVYYIKSATHAIFRKDIAQKLIIEFKFAHKVFSGFLVGKILDSLIIGILCYICCLIMQMPYTPLISVIVGVTNVIPFFGPFIGAIPSFIIILLETPFTWHPWGFLIFILALQQLDGNVIGPKILGDKTGVGAFWVLFSIILFGGLFGFIGMIIAVPLWAIISRLFDEFVVSRLIEKNYPLTREEYYKLKEYHLSLQKENTTKNNIKKEKIKQNEIKAKRKTK